MTRIAFIGGGNMATSIIGGLLSQGEIKANAMQVADPSLDQRLALEKKFGIGVSADNRATVSQADVVILAVKPQVMKAVLEPLRPILSEKQPLIISIAAGISMASLAKWSGCKALVRTMPNTPALLKQGATALFGSDALNQEQRILADSLLRAVGLTIWVKTEEEIDAVTALSGSGPAYFFLLMEAMIEAGIEMGLSAETATTLTIQTATGAAQMAQDAQVNVAELRRRVTSPGGTTERALQHFEKSEFTGIVCDALQSARLRAQELSKQLAN